MKKITIAILGALALAGCVSKREYAKFVRAQTSLDVELGNAFESTGKAFQRLQQHNREIEDRISALEQKAAPEK